MGPMSPVRADPHWAGLCPVKTEKLYGIRKVIFWFFMGNI